MGFWYIFAFFATVCIFCNVKCEFYRSDDRTDQVAFFNEDKNNASLKTLDGDEVELFNDNNEAIADVVFIFVERWTTGNASYQVWFDGEFAFDIGLLNSSDIQDIQAIPGLSNDYYVKFSMSVVYKIKNSVPETTKCLLHPKHTSNTLPTTLEISLTYPEKRYDGYLYSTKSTTLYSPKYDHTIRSSGQLNVEYASSAFFTLVCGSKSVEGLAGGSHLAHWTIEPYGNETLADVESLQLKLSRRTVIYLKNNNLYKDFGDGLFAFSYYTSSGLHYQTRMSITFANGSVINVSSGDSSVYRSFGRWEKIKRLECSFLQGVSSEFHPSWFRVIASTDVFVETDVSQPSTEVNFYSFPRTLRKNGGTPDNFYAFYHPSVELRDPKLTFGYTYEEEKIFPTLLKHPKFDHMKVGKMPLGINYIDVRIKSIITNRHTIILSRTNVNVYDSNNPKLTPLVTFPVPNIDNTYLFKFSVTGTAGYVSTNLRLYYNYFHQYSSYTKVSTWLYHDLALFKFKVPVKQDSTLKCTVYAPSGSMVLEFPVIPEPTTTTTTTTPTTTTTSTPTTTTTSTPTTTPNPIDLPSSPTCSGSECLYEISIPQSDSADNVSCTSQLNGVKDVTFNCFTSLDSSVKNVQCNNESFNATYGFEFDTVSNFVLFCQSNERLLFNKSLSISIIPTQIVVSHTTFVDNKVTVIFAQLKNVEEVTSLRVQELDEDGNLIGQVFEIADKTLVQNLSSLTVDHVFEKDRIYSLKMKFRNGDYFAEIEKQIVTATVTIVSSKKFHVNSNTDKFDALFNLTLSSSIFDNLELTYRWRILDESYVTRDTIVTKKFPQKTACYDVDVNITSVNFTTAMATTNVCLQVGINVTLDYIRGIKLGDQTTFTLIVDQIGPDSCLMLDRVASNKSILFLQEGTNTTQSSCTTRGLTTGKKFINRYFYNNTDTGLFTGTHDFLFEAEGQFHVNLIAENEVTSQLENAVVDVINLNCRSPDIEIIGVGNNDDISQSYMKSENFTLESRVTIDCNDSKVFSSVWSINTGFYYNESVALNIDLKKLKLLFKSNTFKYGMYRFCSKVVMVIDDRFQRERCGFVKIIASPLIANIFGGDKLTIPLEEVYTIDASLSRDPDNKNLNGVEFYFLCRSLTDSTFNLTYENVKDLPIRDFEDNVNNDANNSTGMGGCYGNGEGRLMAGISNTKITLHTPSLMDGMTAEVVLLMYSPFPVDNPRTSFIIQRLKVMSGNPPLLQLSNTRNSKKYVNPNKEQVFTGSCRSNCDGDLKFKWSLFTCSNETSDCERVASDQLKGFLKGPMENTLYYHTKSGVYEANQWYLVMFRAYRNNNTYGEVSFRFFVNLSPRSGECKVSPDTGVVLQDTFKFSCSNWEDEHTPLTYKFYTFREGVLKNICNGKFSYCNVVLPIGEEEEDYKYPVYIAITDKLGGSTIVHVNLTVFPNEDTSSALDSVKTLFTSSNGSSQADSLIKSGDFETLANIAEAGVSILNNQVKPKNSSKNATSEELEAALNETLNRINLRNAIFNQVALMPIGDVNDVNRITGSLSSIYQNPLEISPDSQESATNMLGSFIKTIDELESVDDAVDSLSNVLDVSSKLLQSSSAMADVNDPNNTEVKAIKSMESNSTKTKILISNVEAQLKAAQETLNKFAVPDSEPVVINTKDATLGASKVTMGNEKNADVQAGGVGAKFNQSMFMNDQNFSSEYERAQSSLSVKIKKTKNSFTYDASASMVKSSVTGINFASKDGKSISVNNTEEPIEIIIENNAPVIQPKMFTMGVEDDDHQTNFHTVKLSNESFRAVILPVENVKLEVYLQVKKRPTPEKYLFRWELPDNSSCVWRNETKHVNEMIDLLQVDRNETLCTRDVYSIFVSDKHNIDGVAYLGVFYTPKESASKQEEPVPAPKRKRRSTNKKIDNDKVDEEFCVVIKPPPPTPAPTLPPGEWLEQPPVYTNESLNFTISITKAKCLFWDPENEKWGSDGCVVGIETTPDKTQCLCNHLTDFGGDVMVAPNPIDMSQVFAGLKNLGDNLGVLMVILTLWCVYTLLMIWAKKKDRKDKIDEQIITIDCTNGVDDIEQSLLLNIFTGAGFGSGTTANVYCVVSGVQGTSEIIPLRFEDKRLFMARSTVAIKVHLPKNVGQITSIKLFHDNSGTSPSWYLRSILAIDLSKQQEYSFVCDSWLAVESDDGQIERTLTVAKEEELKQFHLVFASTVSKGLLDGHIWFSVFMRPKQSPFTRVRRLSACLALIFLVMLTNAMFFGVGDDPRSRKVIWLGNFKINFTGIIIGIQSSIIIIPPSIIIIEIFRRLGPKKEKPSNGSSRNNSINEQLVVVEDDGECQVDDRSKEQIKNSEIEKEEKKKKKPFLLPNQCQYIAYFVVFGCVASSSLICFFYSMMWGPRKSNEWLASMFFGFFQSVLVIQPVKAVVVALLMAAIFRKPVKVDKIEEKTTVESMKDKKKEKETEGEKEEKDLAGDDGIITADEVPIIRPSDSEISKARKLKIREKMTGIVIKDIATYLIFLLVVGKLAYSEKDYHTYIYRKDMVNMLSEAMYAAGPKFGDVSNSGYFYSWMRDTLIPGVFEGPWYNDELPKYSGFIDNHESLLVSIPRIRQVRVKKESCPIHTVFKNAISHCETSFSESDEETDDYGTGWEYLNSSTPSLRKRRSTWTVRNNQENETSIHGLRQRREVTGGSSQYQSMSTGRGSSLRRRNKMKNTVSGSSAPIYFVSPEALHEDGTVISCSDRWEFFTANELRGFPIVGRATTYSGNGYVANLGYNEETSWTVLADLHSHNWLDKQTRAVFAEFTIYNGNINLFMTAFLYIETLPTGGAFPWADFKVFNGYRYSAKDGLQSMWAEMVFIGFIIYFAVREVRKLLKQKCGYFKSFFNLIEAVLIPLYLVMFVLIIARWLTTSANIKSFKQNPKDFVSFQYSAATDSALMAVIGISCFLLNIKFLRLLQFAKLFFVIGKVIQNFTYPLMMFMVPFGAYYLLFCWCAHLGFGGQLEAYQTIPRTLTTQLLHLLGTTDFESIKEASPIFGPMYFLAYSIFMLFVGFNMFMAIICESIDGDYDEEFEKHAGDIQVVEFMTKKFKLLLGRNVDDEIRVDGENLVDDNDDKLCFTERQMDALEQSFNRLENFVDYIDVDLQFEETIGRFLSKKQPLSKKQANVQTMLDVIDETAVVEDFSDVSDVEYC